MFNLLQPERRVCRERFTLQLYKMLYMLLLYFRSMFWVLRGRTLWQVWYSPFQPCFKPTSCFQGVTNGTLQLLTV